MDNSIRVMVERGKKKRTVACAFDWSGWDRSGKTEEEALRVLQSYRPRYAKVAALAELSDEFGAAGDLAVVERLEGIGMTDYYGLSGRSAGPEQDQMTEPEGERKVALLRASWSYFDDVAGRVSPELRDLGSFKRTVGEIVDQYKPAVAVVENEENTAAYFTGSAHDYMTELGAVCEVAHSRHISCANGGLLMASVTWLVYFHYLDSGQTSKAQSFQSTGLESFQQERLATPDGVQVARQVADHTLEFLKLYKAAGADYMNIHWYGSSPEALRESVGYLKELSGLPVITNEIGQRNLDPAVTTGLMSMVVELRLPIAVWFSSDATLAKALVDQDGSLRPTGEAFGSFIQQHYG